MEVLIVLGQNARNGGWRNEDPHILQKFLDLGLRHIGHMLLSVDQRLHARTKFSLPCNLLNKIPYIMIEENESKKEEI